MVTDAEGNVGDALLLSNVASKGKRGGCPVPLAGVPRDALVALKATRNGVEPGDRIIHSERDIGMSPGAVQVWFHRLYADLGFAGASSHSGRRTFVTRCARKIVEAGGSLRDVQELAGHASLSATQRYIQGDTAAKRRVVDLCREAAVGRVEANASERRRNDRDADRRKSRGGHLARQ